jgi:hypothetical protein
MEDAFPSKRQFLIDHGYGCYFVLKKGVMEIPEKYSNLKVIERKETKYIEVDLKTYNSIGPWIKVFECEGITLQKEMIEKKFFDVK